ncbi:hypothetical protein NPIL_75851 [Nephila pilipes]|uniref:Uncharacterized protein n=1 Tax=Nephila pilipes TaxID=299642 RepID=A0A8X6PNB3_NEPPI|nr:hypothetical protein NPIL_75851 [Nephila pilipes]
MLKNWIVRRRRVSFDIHPNEGFVDRHASTNSLANVRVSREIGSARKNAKEERPLPQRNQLQNLVNGAGRWTRVLGDSLHKTFRPEMIVSSWRSCGHLTPADFNLALGLTSQNVWCSMIVVLGGRGCLKHRRLRSRVAVGLRMELFRGFVIVVLGGFALPNLSGFRFVLEVGL